MSARQARASGAGGRSGPASPAEPLRRSLRKSGPGTPPQAPSGPRTRLRPCGQAELTATPAAPGPQEGAGKIVLRKIVAPVAESPSVRTPRRSPRIASLSEKENCLPGPEPTWEDLFKPCAAPATPASPPVAPLPGTDSASRAGHPDLRDLEMSKKVRRSYSRLGSPGAMATSTPGAAGRPSCFGFEGLLAAEEAPKVSPVLCSKAPAAVQVPNKPWVPDTSLPGISPLVAKEKRKKKKLPVVLKSELDEWAAAMNAEFAAAEEFNLLIE